MLYNLKNNIYATLITCLTIILLVIAFLILPLYWQIQDDSKELILIKNNDFTFEMQKNQIENLKKDGSQYLSNLALIDQLFIDPKNPVNFIKFLEDTALSAGIKPKISLAQDLQTKDQNSLSFKLFASDDFLKIMDFSEKLEYGPYLVKIQDLSIKNQDLGAPINQINSNNQKANISKNVDAVFVISAFTK